MLDPRLAGDGLRTLVDLLSDAVREPEAIGVVVDRAKLPAARVRRSGTALYDWHAVVTAADDRHPGALDALLGELLHYMEAMGVHKAKLEAWMARGSRRSELVTVVGEIEALAASVAATADPRDAGAVLASVRGTLLDLRDGFEDTDAWTPVLAFDTATAISARSDILCACRQARAAVDNLITGLALASKLANSRRPSDGEDVVFAREQAIVRILIDDREDVEVKIEGLVVTLRAHAPGLFSPRTE